MTSLQESIESLSALLTSAQGLIARREGIMNVQDYLEECKVREGESDMRLGTRMEEGEIERREGLFVYPVRISRE